MKRSILIAIMILVSVGIVFAQVDIPGNNLTSPQSTATSGRLRSNADNFIRADAYSGIKFDKFFSMIGYQNADSKTNFGFATKSDSLYLGVYYGGSFWANVPTFTYTEKPGTWLGKADDDVKNYSSLSLNGTGPSNTLSVLVGVANMGFRLSLHTTKQFFSDTEFQSGGTDYRNYSDESGVFTPQLLWSMSKGLTDKGIQPYVAVNMAFTKKETRFSEYDPNDSYKPTDDQLSGDTDINTVTTVSAGLGGYTLYNKDGFKLSADLDYVLGITGYDNEYNYTDSKGKTQIKTGFKGTISGSTYTETSKTEHTITPSVSGQWSGGPLSFRAKLNLGVPITETKTTENVKKSGATDGSLVKDGDDKTVTDIAFNPDLRLAAQWKIIPKLALNLGGRINFTKLTTTITEGQKYNNNNLVAKSSYTKTEFYKTGTFASTLAMGVTLNATDNLTFEVASGASNGGINVFGNTSGSNGLLYFTNLLVSLRY